MMASTTWTTWTMDVTNATNTSAWIDWSNNVTTTTCINVAWTTWVPEALTLADKLRNRRTQRPIKERALELLRSILDEEQWQDWRRYGSVRVTGSEGGLYEIGCGWAGMLYRLDPVTEEPLEKLCVHPPSHYPVGDRVATLVLALETDEAGVLAKANTHGWFDREKERVKLRRVHRAAS